MGNITLLYSLFLPLIISLCTVTAQARVHDYETTRLKSTGGAGVGSLLANEAAILNPASLAFFSSSSLYFQRETTEYGGGEEGRPVDPAYAGQFKSQGLIVADSRPHLRGAFSYQKQREGSFSRRRISLALASILSKDSSLGFLYRKTTDEAHLGHSLGPSVPIRESYHQFVVGSTRAIDETFTVGAIIVDPFKTRPQDVRAIVGGQYVFKNILAFIADIGGNYTRDLTNSRVLRGALQLNVFKDFFLRAGLFEDRNLDEKGHGFGLAWVGPRLVLETSVKKTQDLGLRENQDQNAPSEMTETSFALSYFF